MPIPRMDDATAEPQTLDEIAEWHQDVADALVARRASTLRAILDGSPIASKFVGMTEGDVEAHFTSIRCELDRLTVFNLVASAEASIRVDFFRRVKGKLKDPLSRAYREWFGTLTRNKQSRPDFDEAGILHHLKKSRVIDAHIIGRFRECLAARHWVGHGRYWAKPVGVGNFIPADVHARAERILRKLPS